MAYLIDSDVLITAKNRYYGFDICPGFWDALLRHHEQGALFSLDRVRQELLAGRDEDELVQWASQVTPADFYLSTHEANVANSFTEVMLWAQQNPQFYDAAKAKFATGADGWLVAYARVHGHTIVTNEQPRPQARNEIKLPDACVQFGVEFQDTFAMLKALRVQFGLIEGG